MPVIMSILTNKQKDFCAYTGAFGAMISATCLIQLMVISREHWLSFVLLGVYALAILAFVFLALQKAIAPWLLIAAAVLLFLAMAAYILSGVFSLVAFLVSLYSVVIVILLFVEQLPQKLKEKGLAEKAEKLIWKDKI